MRALAVSGPSFGGKTHLITKLIDDLPSLKVINFEKHFNKHSTINGYRDFFEDIQGYLDAGYDVLAESYYSPRSNPFTVREFSEMVDIVCYPDYRQHAHNVAMFKNHFGANEFKRRSGGISVDQMRAMYKKHVPSKYVLFDGTNYDSVVNKVKGFVNVDSRKHNDSQRGT